MFSPGPNIILLTASGARFGFRRTIPHLLGVVIGVGIIGGVTGLGLGALLLAQPQLSLTFKIIAAVWILYLGWRLFQSTRNLATRKSERPFRFYQAVLFQWVNPKIWAVAFAASAGYGIGLRPEQEALRLAVTFMSINFFVCLFWSSAGHFLQHLLSSERAWRIFMTGMALLLGLSAIMVFL